ncbi:cell wall-binding repeat-containing protein [Agromyces sp. NPDC058484]|uniref:cell wall-binding repeat-containing protein n=1 Tax=Agromyces sp. NPDC058484 TaxID=3346524 RepID=UPI003651E7EE
MAAICIGIILSMLGGGNALAATAGDAATEDAATMTLTGSVVGLAVDGSELPSSSATSTEVELHGIDDDLYETVRSSPFTFNGLTPGNRYTVHAAPIGPYPGTYAGDTPHRSNAQVFTATTNDIRIRMPIGAVASGTTAYAPGWTEPPQISVYAYRLNERTQRYEWLRAARDSSGHFSLTLYPGTYMFRARGGWSLASGVFHGDQFWNGSDGLAGADVATLDSGEALSAMKFNVPRFSFTTDRLAGGDRYETSVLTTRTTFVPGLPVVYVASGTNWPDALSAGPAAAKRGGALLLTHPASLPELVRDEIVRLQPEEIVVVGSPASVSDNVVSQLESIAPSVRRIGGADRYETSRMLVADAFGTGPHEKVMLATGTSFPDALTASPAAGARGFPLLLVYGAAEVLDAPTRAAVAALEPRYAHIVGGPPSVSSGIESELAASGLVEQTARTAGADRYETSIMMSSLGNSGTDLRTRAYLATGVGFADALGGATAAAAKSAPIILTPPTCVRDGALRELRDRGMDEIVLLGGESTLSRDVQNLTAC